MTAMASSITHTAKRFATTAWTMTAMAKSIRRTQTVAVKNALLKPRAPLAFSADSTVAAFTIAQTGFGAAMKRVLIAAQIARSSANPAAFATSPPTAPRVVASTAFANDPRPRRTDNRSHRVGRPSTAATAGVGRCRGDQGRRRAHQSGPRSAQEPARRGTALGGPAQRRAGRRAERHGAHERRWSAGARTRRCARDCRRVFRLRMSILPAVLRDHLPGPQKGVCRYRQGALRIPGLPAR